MIRALLSYPLLARELTERAARRRTYAGRVLYGLALYTLFLLALWRLVGDATNDPTGFGVLGLGRGMFTRLVELQCWGVLLFQPALMAGVLTYEKERESFSLLLLTGMSPAKLLLEKYLAGLLPMATLLLLALPLGAITMGYGGVSPRLLAAGAAVVLATWLHTGAFALLCSAWCRTTVGALLAAYLGGALVHLAAAIGYSFAVRYVLWGADLRGLDVPGWLWSLWPPDVFQRVVAVLENIVPHGMWPSFREWRWLMMRTIPPFVPLLVSTAAFLLLAGLVMLPRALAIGRSGSSRRFPRITRIFDRATRSLHSLWRKRGDLPADDPVSWRESGRGMLGRGAHSFEFAGMAAGLTLAVCLLLAGLYPRTAGPERLNHLILLLGTASVLIFVVRATGSLLSEQADQTLDILLTTPLGAGEIVRQKARALGGYWLLLGAMLGCVFASKGWFEFEFVRSSERLQPLLRYWAVPALALLVYPPLVVWVSVFFAMWLRVRMRAIVAALAFIAAWFLGPLVIPATAFPESWEWEGRAVSAWFSLLSPLGILRANDQDKLGRFVEGGYMGGGAGEAAKWLPVIVNFATYAVLLLLVRAVCLRLADRLLRRGGRSG